GGRARERGHDVCRSHRQSHEARLPYCREAVHERRPEGGSARLRGEARPALEGTLTSPEVARRDLQPLFDPSSIAVLGATDTPGKWGYWLAQNALRSKGRRSVWLVNRSGREMFGEPSYASLRELPGPAELVVISVGAEQFEEAADE